MRQEELSPNNLVEQTRRSAFDAEIKRRLGDSLNLPEKQPKEVTDPFNDFDFEE